MSENDSTLTFREADDAPSVIERAQRMVELYDAYMMAEPTDADLDEYIEESRENCGDIARAYVEAVEALKSARDHVAACWDNGDAEYADEIKADLDKIDAAIRKVQPTDGAEPDSAKVRE